jgi:FRG domain
MIPHEIIVNDLTDYVKYITTQDGLNCGHAVFRGISDSNYYLISTLGRCQTLEEDYEGELMRSFKKRVRPSLDIEPRNEWEWLALAQHYGLPTRLLDWSFSPLIALYFATKPKATSSGTLENRIAVAAVYALHFCTYIDEDVASPQEIKGVGFYIPPSDNPRVSSQLGLFSIHERYRENLLDQDLTKNGISIYKFLIPIEAIEKIQKQLYLFGIRHGVLFPDLDGFSYEHRLRHNFVESHNIDGAPQC